MNEMKIYLFRYFYKGYWYQLEIPAVSREDAEERVKCITSAEYDDVMQFDYTSALMN